MNIKLKYKVGQKVSLPSCIVTTIGFEYVQGRGTRYIFLTIKDTVTDWLYLYEFEVDKLLGK